MSSKIEILKKCEWCGNEFIARKTTTSYCSHRCASIAYKDRTRKNRIEAIQKELINKEQNRPIEVIKEKEYLVPSQAAKLLGISRATIYRYIAENLITVAQFKGKTLIRKRDIESLFNNSNVYKKRIPKRKSPITEFYTTAEIKEKFNIGETWIFSIAKKHNIPKTFNKGKTYWSKTHIDKYFAKKAHDPEITEWYTVKEIQDKFNLTLNAIYTVASKDVIPKKKEGKTVYYSKKHFDVAKGIATQDEPQYYMVAEAMEKYNITRDQLYHYVKFHNIPRVKFGKYIKISKPELDKILGGPKIE